MTNSKFFLAPLRGLTGREFRQALTKYFSGISACVMPFFSVTDNIANRFSKYSDCFTEDELTHCCDYQVIPQIIGNNANAISAFCKMLQDNGFNNVNFNMGCPMPQITKKMRGSGLLPHPDVIRSILDNVFLLDGLHFSIKLRLGLKDMEEIFPVISVMNDYSLDYVIVHPRLATDKYGGDVNLKTFEHVMSETHHSIVYNGDITDNNSFHNIAMQFPKIKSYMIGRGLLYKPFLVEELIAGKEMSYDERILRFEEFYSYFIEIMKIKHNYCSHVKAYWKYFKEIYSDGEERYQKIIHENDDLPLNIFFKSRNE